MSNDKKMKKRMSIARIETEIMQTQNWVNYWLHYATSEANHARNVTTTMTMVYENERVEVKLSSVELEAEAFATAERHMKHIADLNEEKLKLIAELELLDNESIITRFKDICPG